MIRSACCVSMVEQASERQRPPGARSTHQRRGAKPRSSTDGNHQCLLKRLADLSKPFDPSTLRLGSGLRAQGTPFDEGHRWRPSADSTQAAKSRRAEPEDVTAAGLRSCAGSRLDRQVRVRSATATASPARVSRPRVSIRPCCCSWRHACRATAAGGTWVDQCS